jgi:sulfide dehydrogenase cytochrome subunit
MRIQIPIPFLLISSLLLMSAHPVGAVGVTQGMMLSNSCAGCHGTDGKSPGAIPSINGKSAEFITQSLEEFRAGSKPSTVMERHAKGYSDEEIKMIAEYFSRLK